MKKFPISHMTKRAAPAAEVAAVKNVSKQKLKAYEFRYSLIQILSLEIKVR